MNKRLHATLVNIHMSRSDPLFQNSDDGVIDSKMFSVLSIFNRVDSCAWSEGSTLYRTWLDTYIAVAIVVSCNLLSFVKYSKQGLSCLQHLILLMFTHHDTKPDLSNLTSVMWWELVLPVQLDSKSYASFFSFLFTFFFFFFFSIELNLYVLCNGKRQFRETMNLRSDLCTSLGKVEWKTSRNTSSCPYCKLPFTIPLMSKERLGCKVLGIRIVRVS